jgi:mannose-6-phosphate isomerase-like protein (cupin superfamily)
MGFKRYASSNSLPQDQESCSLRGMPALLLIPALIGLQAAVSAASQAPPPAPSSATTSSVYISAAEIDATLKQSIANNVVDQPMKAMDITTPSGHRASLALLRRTKEETTALIHDRVTEIYQIVDGAGTLVTGGRLSDAKPTDLTRLNAGPSQTGVHQGGDSRRVGPRDVIIIPAGTPHRFSALDGPITYLVYRFEPK